MSIAALLVPNSRRAASVKGIAAPVAATAAAAQAAAIGLTPCPKAPTAACPPPAPPPSPAVSCPRRTSATASPPASTLGAFDFFLGGARTNFQSGWSRLCCSAICAAWSIYLCRSESLRFLHFCPNILLITLLSSSGCDDLSCARYSCANTMNEFIGLAILSFFVLLPAVDWLCFLLPDLDRGGSAPAPTCCGSGSRMC